jgi:hypothetical protein
MIKTLALDLDKKTYTDLMARISRSIKSPPLDPSSHKYFQELQDRISQVIPADYVVVVSDELRYNIQTKKNSVWIFSVEKAKVLIYKPKPFAFPQMSKYDPITKEDEKTYIDDNKDPYVAEISIASNSLLPEDSANDIVRHIQTYLNKHKDNPDPLSDLIKNIKFFFLTKVESIFIHIILANKKTLSYSLPELDNTDLQDQILQINFRFNGKAGTHSLLVFEKQGPNDNFMSRVTSKWKEVLLIISMMFVLVILSACTNNRSHYLGMDITGVCQNKSMFIAAIATALVTLVVVKNFKKSKEKLKNLKKKKRTTY